MYAWKKVLKYCGEHLYLLYNLLKRDGWWEDGGREAGGSKGEQREGGWKEGSTDGGGRGVLSWGRARVNSPGDPGEPWSSGGKARPPGR